MNNRWSTPIAIVMLLSMLGVAAALAYEAQNAARSHRTTAENVLREYAAFAAWEFSRVARRDLTDTFGSLIGHVAVSCRSDTPPDLAQIKAKGG